MTRPAQLADLDTERALTLAPPGPAPTTAEGWMHLERELVAAHVADLARRGACFVDPDRTWVGLRATVAPGGRVWPDVVLRGASTVRAAAEIQSGCWLEDTDVGEGALVRPHTVAQGAIIGPRCKVGPMAHLRPGTILHDDVHVGNFVETKNTTMHAGAKANHLTYLGDATVGSAANVGAGTITCNYDGAGKYHTAIGAGAFIGSNSSLVAPVVVGDGAIIGAGSVITSDVPAEAVALERAELRILAGRAPGLRQRNAERARRG